MASRGGNWGIFRVSNIPSLLQAATTAIKQAIMPTVTEDSLMVVGCL